MSGVLFWRWHSFLNIFSRHASLDSLVLQWFLWLYWCSFLCWVLVRCVGWPCRFYFWSLEGLFFFGLCVVAVWGFVGSVGSCGFLWVNFWFLFLCWFVSWFLGYLLFVSMLVSLFEFLSVSGMVSKYCVG